MLKIVRLLMFMGLLVFTVTLWAVPIGTVGSRDVLRAQTNLSNSGSGNEESWIESVLGKDITYSQLGGSGASSWEAVVGGTSGDFAFNLGAAVSHFLVKVGGGKGTGTSNTHFLFNNKNSLQWAFVNLSNFGSGVKLHNIGIISHVGTANGDGATVPGPAPFVVMAIGLLGMLGAGRIRNA